MTTKHFPQANDEEVSEVLKQIEPIISEMSGLASIQFNYPVESYHSDLEELSKDFPVLAFQLRGIENIAKIHQQLLSLVRSSFTELDDGTTERLFKGTAMQSDDANKLLEARIKTTARKVSYLMFAKISCFTLRRIKKADKVGESELQKQMDAYEANLNEFMQELVSTQSTSFESAPTPSIVPTT
ncbi:hypothetical protein [Pelagicoccus sp. SDUM812005]|uniref:hypothetical protein n=1 Tax=Pelagicoccus sp. SDUM812005 TaxID=3041257 RepID=UPI0028126B1E|nr:hypothetical protein [Pelagicoccus sp. SDUM812005]